MAYIGNAPNTAIVNQTTSQSFNGTGSATTFTLNRSVNVGEDLEVFVNNVQQEPGSGKSYTASGTTLTFDEAPPSGTGNVYVIYRGEATINPRLEHDANAALSATTGTFSGAVSGTTGTFTGAFTSPGIDDNADATAITIDSSENVGIGTTTPGTYTAYVSGSTSPGLAVAGTQPALVLSDTDISGNDGTLGITKSGEDTIINNLGDGNIKFFNNGGERLTIDSSGTATFTEGDAITVIDRVGTNVAGIKTGSGDDFCVGTADYPQAIRIKNNTGQIGIGETAPDTAFDIYRAAGDVSQVQTGRTTNSNVGMIRFRDGDDNACGQITSNPSTNTTNYVTSSDYRLKENVVDMTGAITRVKTLSPKRFNFISNADVTVDGFLAHEAQAVVPEAVVGEHNEVDDDGNMVVQGIDLAKLVPLLTGALQEAVAKIETLEAKVAALEGN